MKDRPPAPVLTEADLARRPLFRAVLVPVDQVAELPARPPVQSPYLDLNQAAEYCRLAVQTLKNQSRHIERLPGTRRWLTTREALDKFLSARRRRKPR